MDAERRRLLVRIAADEFASAGYDDASLNRIIARSGMSKSSFYYVLPSKNELFDFVLRELTADVGGKIAVPDPDEFAGDEFWPRLTEFFAELVRASEREHAFLTLGRLFYRQAAQDAQGVVSGTLAAVRTWVENVLRVGRSCGAVRDDLPESLQCSLVFRILQVFDEWTIHHYDEFTPGQLGRLADAQFGTIRRLIQPE
jgi:AcrR family transcriptional regulator